MLFQQSWRSSHICWALVGSLFFTLWSNSSQTISVWFRSGDCGGQVIWCSTPSLSFLENGPYTAWRCVLGHCPVEKQMTVPLSVFWILNKSPTVSQAKPPHTITPPPPCLTVGTTHAEIIRSPSLRLTKTWRLEPKISNLGSSDQRTDFHRSNVHCSCFSAQASLLFFFLVSFSCGFFAVIRPWRPDSCSLPSEQLMLRCLLLELSEAFT